MEPILIHDAEVPVSTKEFKYAYWPFENFNPVQSAIFPYVSTDKNMVIAAATSAGKTIMGEMFISDEIRRRGGKGLYVGPLKSLAKEKMDDWTDPDHHFKDLKISICTGDFQFTKSRIEELNNANVISMTPEMLASRCRNIKSEKSTFLSDVGVIVFDESHLLTVPSRGDHIEVAMMKMSEINPNCRFVLLSATMPNVDQMCGWLSKLTGRETALIVSTYRPCPLNKHYPVYFDKNGSYWANEVEKVGTAVSIVQKHRQDKCLVFVHSKDTGELVKETLTEMGVETDFYNADCSLDKRLNLEDRFKNDSKFRVLISTSSLAWGCYEKSERLLGENGRLIEAGLIKAGETLLCPVDQSYKNRKVVRVEHRYFNKSYFVKLSTGEEMKVSPDHIFYAAAGRKSPNWIEVNKLKKGDYLARPNDLKLWNKKSEFDQFWYMVGFCFGDGCLVDVGNHKDQSQKAVLDICLGKVDAHSEYIRKLFNDHFDHELEYNFCLAGVPHIRTKRKATVDQFLPLLPLGRKNGNDDIPTKVYENEIYISNFLSGLFDADGGVESHSNNNWSIGLSNISKKVITSVQTLLLGFGITSSIGRKKMKDLTINGRFHPARRSHTWRLRIFGSQNMRKFSEFIGFKHHEKIHYLSYVLNKKETYSMDYIPARELLKEHGEINNIKVPWTVETKLSELVKMPIHWSRIVEIKEAESGTFCEIEVEDPHAYVGSGVISHNCNLPARRVIIVGVHSGTRVVENYDIDQMCGRSGRPKYDPQGDAHILIPESQKATWLIKLRQPTLIKSQLLQNVNGRYKVLAFHVISEIHHKSIQTKAGFRKWFAKSLAHFQDQKFDDHLIDGVIDLLEKNRCIVVEDGIYKTTALGNIASMFYFSPFDVADLRKNFQKVFSNKQEKSDLHVAIALGNIDSHRIGFATRAEKDVINLFLRKFKIPNDLMTEGAAKAACTYYKMLTGEHSKELNNCKTGLRSDLERTMEVISTIDQMSGRWDGKNYFNILRQRLMYGVPPELIPYISLKGIGKVRAERLYKAGVTLEKIPTMTDEQLGNIMKYKNKEGLQKMRAEVEALLKTK